MPVLQVYYRLNITKITIKLKTLIFGNKPIKLFVIQEVTIKNFKSVQDLTLPLSRFNVFIGSNGSGKSNILEAIAFGAAAAADKLDNEFLASRGIRISDARLMKSAFNKESPPSTIDLIFQTTGFDFSISLGEETSAIFKWEHIDSDIVPKMIVNNDGLQLLRKDLSAIFTREKVRLLPMSVNKILLEVLDGEELFNFIIYSPEISSLRKFEEESQILPLGIKGEGLFNVLQIFNESYGQETLEELKEFLHIIEWFDDFEAINDQVSGRKSLVVKDRYIPDIPLNQTNVNEGFLFLLFYVSLLISKETPAFFAIDNIEASFHPRLCEELTRRLVELCKKHDKQVIITTHNPAVLDGLNLNDADQALFVVRRNADGETIADKIDKQPASVKLSEAWERGYIGGQPETIA